MKTMVELHVPFAYRKPQNSPAALLRWIVTAAALTVATGVADAQYLISTYAGGLPGPTSAAANTYSFRNPSGVALDPFGNTYISTVSNCVFRLDSNGNLSRVAGACKAGFSGDGGNALSAQLNNPQGLALDAAGNLYIADQGNQRIRQVTPAGIITTVAGTGAAGYSGDNVPASTAQLNSPQGVVVDPAGNVYVADKNNQRIRKFTVGGTISTIAGTGVTGATGDGAAATKATLTYPLAVALDSAGNLYLDDESSQVRMVNTAGIILHIAGTGAAGYSGDSGPASTAQLSEPQGLAVDAQGNLYIADEFNYRVRKVNIGGIITTYAGGNGFGSTGDGNPATSAQLSGPVGVAVDYHTNLYIADLSGKVRVVNSGGIINTAAGTGAFPLADGPAGLAQFSEPWGLARDIYPGNPGNLYIADTQNDRLRQITAAGVVSTIAGTGSNKDSGDGGLAVNAGVTPLVVTTDSLGNIYLADVAVIRKIDTTGHISTLAGTGGFGFSGDGGLAINASLQSYLPGLAIDSNQNLYIADLGNQRIRKVSPGHGKTVLDATATITTVAGTGVAGYNGDGAAGTLTQLNFPCGLAVDLLGNLYIADLQNSRVRELSAASGTISTVAGNGAAGSTGDGGPATSAPLAGPFAVTLDASGNLYIANRDGNTIRKVSSPGGIISTIAGNGTAGYSGNGGPATAAQLSYPASVLSDSSGNIYVSDLVNDAVRILAPAGTEPVLTVSITHSGVFTTGQAGAVFTINVSNAALAAATSGAVTVTAALPAGLTLNSMSGTGGWSCPSPNTVCTNSTSVAGGSSFQPIDLVVNVAPSAPPQVTIQVTVAGGGSTGGGAADSAFVGSPVPVLEIAKTHPGNFSLGNNGTYKIEVGNQVSAAPTTGTAVSVMDTLPTGMSLVSMGGGPNWHCTGATCTRSDALGGGAIYDAIAVTVAVASNATSPLVNTANGSGGGSAVSPVDHDSTNIVSLTCNVTGNPTPGIADVQKMINEALGGSAPLNDLNQDGWVNVVDVQIVINAVLGLGCTL